jgi:hypothetical protein
MDTSVLKKLKQFFARLLFWRKPKKGFFISEFRMGVIPPGSKQIIPILFKRKSDDTLFLLTKQEHEELWAKLNEP